MLELSGSVKSDRYQFHAVRIDTVCNLLRTRQHQQQTVRGVRASVATGTAYLIARYVECHHSFLLFYFR